MSNSVILPADVVIPKGRNELLKKLGWKNLVLKGIVDDV